MDVILRILMGILGFGIVVFVHEAGHFLAAKLVGVEVEVFSIGWGSRLVGFRRKNTEYRLSVFPFGGYCKLKGDEALKRAWSAGNEKVDAEPGSFYGVSPWKRIVVGAMGPLFNFGFAILAFSLVWYMGFTTQTFSNRIILESDYPRAQGERAYPAAQAGLETGDTVTRINGREVATYRDIQEIVMENPDRALEFTVLRDGATSSHTVRPEFNPSTGAGRIGVYAWIEPVIETVAKDSPAFIAGLESGDRITAVNGQPVHNTLALDALLTKAGSNPVELTYVRRGQTQTTRLVLHENEAGMPNVGIGYKPLEVRSPKLGLAGALGRGLSETFNTLGLTVRGIAYLFRGMDITQAVAGPLKITYFVGEVASQGFSRGLSSGITAVANFLGLLSVALFFMNLLPIPALDGGLILLFLVEWLRKKPMKPRTIYRYQLVGIVFIFGLLMLATMSDVAFLFGR